MFSQEEEWLLEEGYGGEKSEAFFAARAKLAAGTPLAYLIGHIPFLNTKIYLDSKPLIPRPETEFWVEKALTEINTWQKKTGKDVEVLDLCAGSGCIGVAVLANTKNSQVDFSELENHQETILKNCRENKIEPNRYHIYKSDLFSNLPQTAKYDFILSNPPYIDPVLDRAEKSVKDHEPSIALYGGELGMKIIAKIIETAPEFLNPHGQLWLEHEPEQVKDIRDLAKDHWEVTNHHDQYGVPRFSQLVLK